MLAYLLQIDAVDPATGGAAVVRASSVDDDRVCGLDGERWWPAIAQLPSLRYDLFDGGFAGKIETPQSSLAIAVAAFPTLPALMLADARVRLWSGLPGQAFSAWTKRFDGRCLAQPTIREGIAGLAIAVDDRWLDQPLLGSYAGTGGIEGEAALKGSEKPLAIGAPRFVPGKLINSVENVFQVSVGPIQGVEVAFERLARFGGPTANYASYAALVAATIAPGAWATCLAQGLVRFGAPPAGKVSFHVQGDKGGPDGWVRLPGSVIKRIALLAGGGGRINLTSTASLDVARPWPISPYVENQITARELIQRVAASVNAVAGVTWTGQLFVTPVQIGTASATLDATGGSLPPTMPLEQLEMAPPFWRLAIEAQKNWAVHGLGDVAFTAPLVPRGRYDPNETYREGHLVDLADGSEWLFIATEAATGVSPPVGTQGNATWSRQRPPTQIGDIAGAGDVSALGDGNRVRFSVMESGPRGWARLVNPELITVFEPQQHFGRQYIAAAGAFAANGQVFSFGSSGLVEAGTLIPVRPGERISVQALLAVNNDGNPARDWSLAVGYTDSQGDILPGSPITFANGSGGRAFDLPPIATFLEVPGNAFGMWIEAFGGADFGGAGELVLYLGEAMVSSAGPLQTKHPPFVANQGGELGADVTTEIRAFDAEFRYDYTGNLEPGQARTLTFTLQGPGGPITTGCTWFARIATGGWNGQLAGPTEYPLASDGGVGKAIIGGVEATATAEIICVRLGQRKVRTITLRRVQSAPPALPPVAPSTGGTSPSGAGASKAADWDAVSSTAFTELGRVDMQPSSSGSVALSANLTFTPDVSIGTAFTTITLKWQREVTLDSNTWEDVSAPTTGNTRVYTMMIRERRYAEPIIIPDEPSETTASGATIQNNGSRTGLSGTQRFRLVAAGSNGNLHFVDGVASAVPA